MVDVWAVPVAAYQKLIYGRVLPCKEIPYRRLVGPAFPRIIYVCVCVHVHVCVCVCACVCVCVLYMYMHVRIGPLAIAYVYLLQWWPVILYLYACVWLCAGQESVFG